MKKNNYLFYSDYLKKQDIANKEILISKANGSYLIGPLLNNNFDNNSFYKRLTSNSIYSTNIYKKMLSYKCIKLIEMYKNSLSDNEVIDIEKNGKIIKHKIIRLPGDYNEE